MTVIAVCTDGSRCCMGADSMASHNGSVAILSAAKIIRRGPVLFGTNGTLALGDALRYHLPEPVVTGPLDEWVARTLVPWLREYLLDNELLEKRSERTEWPGTMLVARGPDWLELDGGGSICRLSSNWWAVGSGAAEARGAMHHACQSIGVMEQGTADEIVRAGIEAACDLDDGCRLPLVLEWTS